jgi:hypothetical protein
MTVPIAYGSVASVEGDLERILLLVDLVSQVYLCPCGDREFEFLSREQYRNILSSDVPFVPLLFFRLLLHQRPNQLRGGAGLRHVMPSELGVTLGHLNDREP